MKKQPVIATEAIRIRSGEIKSIGELITEQSVGSPLPSLTLKSIHFVVSPFGSDLVFPPTRFVPEGFTWGVLAGRDLTIQVTKVDSLKGIQGLNFFPVTTKGDGTICDLFLVFEFYPE